MMGAKDLATTWLDRLGFVGVSGAVVLYGFVRGNYWVSVHIDVAFLVLAVGFQEAFLSTLIFSGFVSLSGCLYFVALAVDGGETRTSGPTVAAIVPVYRDAAVLDRSVRSLLASTYEDLDVYVVCEPGDDASIARARELATHDRVTCLVNDASPGSKANAINYAAGRTDGALLGVFDADEVVHPSFVAAAVARLDGDADLVQGRTVPEPTGLVESLAYSESVILSYVSRRLVYLLTGFRLAASRAVVMDREALDAIGGYDPTMVTEDFDFAYRCYAERLTVSEDLRHPSRIEAAHTWRDWWGQRKRWMTGYAQVLHALGDRAFPPADHRDVLSVGICASTLLGSLLALSLFSKFVTVLLWGPDWLFLVPLVAVTLVTLLVRAADVALGVADDLGFVWLLAPLVFPLYSLAAIKAVLEYLFSWEGEWYHVVKGDA
ncbi:MAG: glycosyltransferase family 2 protein [Haloarculaceae archaeon]